MSEAFDTFSGWMLAGFGAVLALLLSNFDKLQTIVSVGEIRRAARIFIWAAALGVVQKFVSIMVVTVAKGRQAGEQLGIEAGAVDLPTYLESARGAFLLPWRAVVTRTINKMSAGDVIYVPRKIMRLAQYQVGVALVESGLILWAAAVLVFAI